MENKENTILSISIAQPDEEDRREISVMSVQEEGVVTPGDFVQLAATSIDLLIQNVTFYNPVGEPIRGEEHVQTVMNLLRETLVVRHTEEG